MRELRGNEISMIFQNPQASLNPARKIGDQMRTLIRHRNRCAREEAAQQAVVLLGKVRMPDPERVLGLYPFECSGGMCQRILIAMALTGRPKLLIADEPTTSLDVTIQAQIIRLILDLKNEFGMSILFVSHDLGIVSSICDRVAVMYRGSIVETAAAAQLFSAPAHPYTKELLESSLSFQWRGTASVVQAKTGEKHKRNASMYNGILWDVSDPRKEASHGTVWIKGRLAAYCSAQE